MVCPRPVENLAPVLHCHAKEGVPVLTGTPFLASSHSFLAHRWRREWPPSRHRSRAVHMAVGRLCHCRFRMREIMLMFIQVMIHVRRVRWMDMRHNRCLEMVLDATLRRMNDRRRYMWWAMHGILLLSSSRLIVDNTSL